MTFELFSQGVDVKNDVMAGRRSFSNVERLFEIGISWREDRSLFLCVAVWIYCIFVRRTIGKLSTRSWIVNYSSKTLESIGVVGERTVRTTRCSHIYWAFLHRWGKIVGFDQLVTFGWRSMLKFVGSSGSRCRNEGCEEKFYYVVGGRELLVLIECITSAIEIDFQVRRLVETSLSLRSS